jgi:hypothetical protein
LCLQQAVSHILPDLTEQKTIVVASPSNL